ncbi:hypothetical protein IWQ48_004225 [Labrenzia sp. EL_13]|nr:hypothetical protein [Labrenzia sp. EL_13]
MRNFGLLVALVLVAIIVGAGPTAAQEARDRVDRFLVGNQLFKACTSNDVMFCTGYIVGVKDGLAAPGAGSDWMNGCIPEGATIRQFKDVVVKYLKQNPELRHGPAAMLVINGIVQGFHCG